MRNAFPSSRQHHGFSPDFILEMQECGTHCEEDGGQEEGDRKYESSAVQVDLKTETESEAPMKAHLFLCSGPSPAESPPLEPTNTHDGAVVDAERLQHPGQAQTHQDVEHVTADGVGDGHVPQT